MRGTLGAGSSIQEAKGQPHKPRLSSSPGASSHPPTLVWSKLVASLVLHPRTSHLSKAKSLSRRSSVGCSAFSRAASTVASPARRLRMYACAGAGANKSVKAKTLRAGLAGLLQRKGQAQHWRCCRMRPRLMQPPFQPPAAR